MDNSILYGFRNPAMTEDIGMSMIERQYPTAITSLGYTPASVTNKSAYFEQPSADTFQTKREKEYSTVKKILVGLGVIALGVLGYKRCSKAVSKVYNSIAPHFSGTVTKGKNVFSNVKNFFSNLFNKAKTKISP